MKTKIPKSKINETHSYSATIKTHEPPQLQQSFQPPTLKPNLKTPNLAHQNPTPMTQPTKTHHRRPTPPPRGTPALRSDDDPPHYRPYHRSAPQKRQWSSICTVLALNIHVGNIDAESQSPKGGAAGGQHRSVSGSSRWVAPLLGCAGQWVAPLGFGREGLG